MVPKSEWPSKVWITLKSAPLARRCVANACRMTCGLTFFGSISARIAHFFNLVSTLLPYAIDSISKVIEDVENYPDIFKRVHNVQILDKNMVRIMLDMPLFLSNRDYVIQYKKNKKITKWEFSFNAIAHKNAPIDKNYVRLINAAGKWELYPKTKNETLLSYTWNGELLGDFPDFALKRAWKTQGNEIIHWITNALK